MYLQSTIFYLLNLSDSKLWWSSIFFPSTYFKLNIVFTVQRSCCFPQEENITELCVGTWRQKSGPELARDYSYGEFSSSLVFLLRAIECLPNHWLRKFRSIHCLRSFKFQICCHFPACNYWQRRAVCLQLASWLSRSLRQETSAQSKTYLCSGSWRSVSGRLMFKLAFWLLT